MGGLEHEDRASLSEEDESNDTIINSSNQHS